MSQCGCSTPSHEKASDRIQVTFLYLDNDTCTRCGGTEGALDQAVADAKPTLKALGKTVEVKKIHVTDRQTAIAHRFVSSPTIRIDGQDLAPKVVESTCAPCSDLAGGTPTDCREWEWHGETHASAPPGLIVEALLRRAIDDADKPTDNAAQDTDFTLPPNLEQFFDADQRACC